MKRILQAARFAAEKHTGQYRKGIDSIPYINHPIEVAELIASIGGITDENVIIAALLHDTIEDTETEPQDLEALFGATVLGYVLEVTDDKSLPKAERKRLQIEQAPYLSVGAKYIKLADKISNVRSVTYTPPQEWPIIQQQEYVEWAYKVYEKLRGVNAELESLFVKEYTNGFELIQQRLFCSSSPVFFEDN